MTLAQNNLGQPHQNHVASRGSFWSHYSTIINFWLDVLLAVIFMVQAWMLAVIHYAFPRGAGPNWKIWGGTPLDWSETLLTTYCVFAIGIVLHVMFHWEWICGVVATRILRKKATKDDGSHTLVGVGVLVVLIHVLIGGVLLARMSLTSAK